MRNKVSFSSPVFFLDLRGGGAIVKGVDLTVHPLDLGSDHRFDKPVGADGGVLPQLHQGGEGKADQSPGLREQMPLESSGGNMGTTEPGKYTEFPRSNASWYRGLPTVT